MALIQKIPTPISPVQSDAESRHITLAYFEQKSTVDYIGAVQGIPVCFDAKECRTDTFPLQNVHDHQVKFMEAFERQGGVAFLLIFYGHRELYYYMSYAELRRFWERSVSGGRKSIRFEELDERFFFSMHGGLLVPYLEPMQLDLESRVSGNAEESAI